MSRTMDDGKRRDWPARFAIVASAHRHDLDAETFTRIFTDILDRLHTGSTDYTNILPDVWKQIHPTALRTYRETERLQRAEYKQACVDVRRLAYAR